MIQLVRETRHVYSIQHIVYSTKGVNGRSLNSAKFVQNKMVPQQTLLDFISRNSFSAKDEGVLQSRKWARYGISSSAKPARVYTLKRKSRNGAAPESITNCHTKHMQRLGIALEPSVTFTNLGDSNAKGQLRCARNMIRLCTEI